MHRYWRTGLVAGRDPRTIAPVSLAGGKGGRDVGKRPSWRPEWWAQAVERLGGRALRLVARARVRWERGRLLEDSETLVVLDLFVDVRVHRNKGLPVVRANDPFPQRLIAFQVFTPGRPFEPLQPCWVSTDAAGDGSPGSTVPVRPFPVLRWVPCLIGLGNVSRRADSVLQCAQQEKNRVRLHFFVGLSETISHRRDDVLPVF
jgi:hypothetical protein